MQQTEKYQLNLIETSDPFSAAPLNENMEKVEAALSVEAAARAGADAALDARLQVLELHKLVAGVYIGNAQQSGDFQIIQVGFTPAVVLIHDVCFNPPRTAFCFPGYPFFNVVEIVEGGFKVTHRRTTSDFSTANIGNTTYRYIAFC